MQYYMVTYDDSRRDLWTVSDYELGNFDVTVFWRGKPFGEALPPHVRLTVDDSEGLLPPDTLPNPISWLIISERLRELWWPYIRDDVERLDPPLYRRSDGRKVTGYTLLNIVRLIACVDVQKSVPLGEAAEDAGFLNLCIKQTCVGDHHLFRPAENATRIVASETIAQLLVGKGIRGIAFIKCKSA